MPKKLKKFDDDMRKNFLGMDKVTVKQIFSNKILWLALALIIVAGVQYIMLNPLDNDIVEKELIDDCGRGFKNVILHSIPDKFICRAECLNYCQTIDKDIYDHEFTHANEGCHTCRCWCR